jgi:hypothetical protein
LSTAHLVAQVMSANLLVAKAKSKRNAIYLALPCLVGVGHVQISISNTTQLTHGGLK